MNLTKNLKLGAFNLLLNCAELSAKHKILIVAENEKLGWYDEFIALVIKECCDELSIKSEILNVGEPSDEIYNRIKKISNNLYRGAKHHINFFLENSNKRNFKY